MGDIFAKQKYESEYKLCQAIIIPNRHYIHYNQKGYHDAVILPQQRKILTELCQKSGFVTKCLLIREEGVFSGIAIQGQAFLAPEWNILRAGDVYDSYLLSDYPEEIDVPAWKKDNPNPAISLIEAKKPLLCLAE